MPHIVADRFLASGRSWVDLAMGSPVRLRLLGMGSRSQQAIWADQCDTLVRLRHPLVNPLVDYGAADSGRLFEAYWMDPPVSASGTAASRLLQHATQFLQSQGVQLTRPLADFALRAVADPQRSSTPAASRCRHARTIRAAKVNSGRPLGVTLQPRRVLNELAEALDAGGGSIAVTVCGGAHSGLSTLRLLAARVARLRGYAPICSTALLRWPWLADALLERHLCIFTGDHALHAERGAVARVLARLGVSSSRAHASVAFHRSEEFVPHALRVDPLGVTAMTSMVYIEREQDAADIFGAARKAEGRPGLFLRHLNATAIDFRLTGAALVHESVAPYEVSIARPAAAPTLRPVPPRRTAHVAARACTYGARLTGEGRHSAAVRVLSRAFRVLHGRGEAKLAASAALQLGWLFRERGQTDAALAQFERARTIHAHEVTAIDAALATAVAWTDDARLHEAEAAARGALAAAGAIGDAARAHTAAVVLARTLFWCLRLNEAATLLEPVLAEPQCSRTADAWALAARISLLDGDRTGALKSATEARRVATAIGEPRSIASAYRASAAAFMSIDDLSAAREHVEAGLAAARKSHAPLIAFKLRALQLMALNATNPGGREAQRLATRLRLVTERSLPSLLQWQLRLACDGTDGSEPAPDTARQFVRSTGARALLQPFGRVDVRLTELQRLLEVCHSAPDDRSALDQLCTAICERLRAASVMLVAKGPERRRLAIAGRPWAGEPHLAFRVLDGAIPIRSLPGESPVQAGEPVLYGGEAIGALCCRWTAGTPTDPERAVALLRLGALAAAPAVRSWLDRTTDTRRDQACPELLGTSPAASSLRDAIGRAARAPFPVLIEGESGTGKELVARAIHRLGPRRDRRFCAINCAALTDDLLEAELFGHARGAFTGAVAERAGLFEEADGGTLFLDEIGELSARAQAKLLRVLQDGEVRRVGENFPRRVDARVVAATNRRLADEVAAGRFRADLRFRLDVVRIDVPPLRERMTDIAALATHFWLDASARVGSGASLAPDALATFARYDWPGNVRELQNAIASIAVHAPRRGRVTAASVPPHIARAAAPINGSFDAARAEFERRFVRAALARTSGHRGRTAKALGVSRQGLAKMMKRLGIE